MLTREQLLQTKEYWFETIQNNIFRMVDEYIRHEGITQTAFAEKLGVTKGYVSQVMNGNFNYTLNRLIELSLATGNAPALEFIKVDDYVCADRQARFEIQYEPYLKLSGPASEFLSIATKAKYLSDNIRETVQDYENSAA